MSWCLIGMPELGRPDADVLRSWDLLWQERRVGLVALRTVQANPLVRTLLGSWVLDTWGFCKGLCPAGRQSCCARGWAGVEVVWEGSVFVMAEGVWSTGGHFL